MEVALERVRARLADRVADRQRRQQRDRGPARPIERAARCSRPAAASRPSVADLQRREERRQRQRRSRARSAPITSSTSVSCACDRMSAASRGIERGIDRLEHRRRVERLVGRAVAIARRVHRGEQDEGKQAERVQDAAKRRTGAQPPSVRLVGGRTVDRRHRHVVQAQVDASAGRDDGSMWFITKCAAPRCAAS